MSCENFLYSFKAGLRPAVSGMGAHAAVRPVLAPLRSGRLLAWAPIPLRGVSQSVTKRRHLDFAAGTLPQWIHALTVSQLGHGPGFPLLGSEIKTAHRRHS